MGRKKSFRSFTSSTKIRFPSLCLRRGPCHRLRRRSDRILSRSSPTFSRIRPADFWAMDMPTVPVGDSVFAVLTSELDVGTPAENATQAETTGAFSASVLSPSRLQASFFYSREDRARFEGMDEALRMNLSDGLSDGLDKQILAGTNGLLTGTNLANHAASAVTDLRGLHFWLWLWPRGRALRLHDFRPPRIVMGSGSYAHAGSVYRNTSVDRNAVDRLNEITSGSR